jgi:hypothetical protein
MNAAIIRALSRGRFLKVWCLVAIATLSFTLTVRATILDDLFQWAAQHPSTNVTTVQFAMTGNQISNNGLVTYSGGSYAGSGGTLYYQSGACNWSSIRPTSFFIGGRRYYRVL